MIRYLITDLPGCEESESSPVNHVEPYWHRNRLSTAGTVIQKREFRSENIKFQAAVDNKNVPLDLILGKSTENLLLWVSGKKRPNQQYFLPKIYIHCMAGNIIEWVNFAANQACQASDCNIIDGPSGIYSRHYIRIKARKI